LAVKIRRRGAGGGRGVPFSFSGEEAAGPKTAGGHRKATYGHVRTNWIGIEGVENIPIFLMIN
jgi:hypothetical protein